MGDECAEERAAHGQASICVSGCIELLLYALALSGAILLRLRSSDRRTTTHAVVPAPDRRVASSELAACKTLAKA